MDNNILASEHGIEQLRQLTYTDYRIDINQGMDIRLLNDEICAVLAGLKWIRFIRFSCDTSAQLPYFERALEMFSRAGVPKSKIFVYLLVRKDLEEADWRVHELHKICSSFSIYAQAERNETKNIIPSKLQLEFARYVYSRGYKKGNWQEWCKMNY